MLDKHWDRCINAVVWNKTYHFDKSPPLNETPIVFFYVRERENVIRINCMYNSRGVHTPRNRRNVEYAYITCERSPVQSSHIQVMYDVFAYALQTAYRICIFARAISSYITRIFFFFLHLFVQTFNQWCAISRYIIHKHSRTLVCNLLDELSLSAYCIRYLNNILIDHLSKHNPLSILSAKGKGNDCEKRDKYSS